MNFLHSFLLVFVFFANFGYSEYKTVLKLYIVKLKFSLFVAKKFRGFSG